MCVCVYFSKCIVIIIVIVFIVNKFCKQNHTKISYMKILIDRDTRWRYSNRAVNFAIANFFEQK